MSYQDMWVRGRLTSKGERECASRYEAIRPFLGRYNRRFSVLDIGASEGYFGLRISEDYDACVTMVEGGGQLLKTCCDNQPSGVVALQHRLSTDDLSTLSRCEHFDIILSLNVLHHFSDWSSALKQILSLGDTVIIETPPPDDGGACGQRSIPGIYDSLSGCDVITRTQSHTSSVHRPMFLAKHSSDPAHWNQTLSYFDAPKRAPGGTVRLTSTVHRQSAHWTRKEETRGWIPGINLRTYQLLNGVWPRPSTVSEWVRQTDLPDGGRHGDVRPWNFILDGRRVHLIDGGDCTAVDDREGLDITALQISQMEEQ